jgi:hypothetical protein
MFFITHRIQASASRNFQAQTFYMVVVDHDLKQFSVDGPATDESKWYEDAGREIAKGRDLLVSPYPSERQLARPAIEAELARQYHGYVRLDPGKILIGDNWR